MLRDVVCMHDFSEEEEDEDFSRGVHHFIEAAAARRLIQVSHVGPFTSQHVGIENRLVAAATLKKTYWSALNSLYAI